MIKIVLALILKLQHVLSESSISFCSSSSTNPNKENYRISNLSLQSQGKAPRVTRIVNDVSNISGNKSIQKDSARPTAEVLDWLQELFDIMGNNGAFRGDGRCLNTIGGALGQDEASLVGVAARTPKNRH
ncbi:unnamed protein product [Rotaria magnacalcarata]|uniref:Uncharacterized protein n=1 Tax=Rotaria magnacalcarata TaxID=392030 RepID=A0A816YUB6_9BILA|nr:unnamed protein product [Rotaria magnacalcarata]